MGRNEKELQKFVGACILAKSLVKHLISAKQVVSFFSHFRLEQHNTSLNTLYDELKRLTRSKDYKRELYDHIQEEIREEEITGKYRRAFDSGMYCCILTDAIFPQLLSEINAAPAILFVKGDYLRNTSAWQDNCLTVIGTRKPSDYGIQVTKSIATELAKRNVIIVSGLAYGIDSCAQRIALENSARVIAVLASSLDQVYPRMHIGLFNAICKDGFAISEHAPGSPLYRQFFPMRNRIMSGMSKVTVVIESSQRSGTQITVEQALAQGRDVWAVPGPIFSPQSKGVNALINHGAFVLHDIQEFIERMKVEGIVPNLSLRQNVFKHSKSFEVNNAPDKVQLETIVKTLASSPTSAEELSLQLGIPINDVFKSLTTLQEMDLINFTGAVYVLASEQLAF